MSGASMGRNSGVLLDFVIKTSKTALNYFSEIA
jgi:hypothetical protein